MDTNAPFSLPPRKDCGKHVFADTEEPHRQMTQSRYPSTSTLLPGRNDVTACKECAMGVMFHRLSGIKIVYDEGKDTITSECQEATCTVESVEPMVALCSFNASLIDWDNTCHPIQSSNSSESTTHADGTVILPDYGRHANDEDAERTLVKIGTDLCRLHAGTVFPRPKPTTWKQRISKLLPKRRKNARTTTLSTSFISDCNQGINPNSSYQESVKRPSTAALKGIKRVRTVSLKRRKARLFPLTYD